MNSLEINQAYLDWLKSFVLQEEYNSSKYDMFFEVLYDIEFTFCLPMDSNREKDGLDLRIKFINNCNYKQENLKFIDNRPCSVLEMLIALSIRCENTFAYNPEYEDRTFIWFWEMISNMGLTGHITNDDFDSTFIENKINRCLERRFESNGRGGLFILPERKEDIRDIDFWKQAGWYFDRVLF